LLVVTFASGWEGSWIERLLMGQQVAVQQRHRRTRSELVAFRRRGLPEPLEVVTQLLAHLMGDVDAGGIHVLDHVDAAVHLKNLGDA
jgi:hypothetical protein